jgi:hypothetical protein
MVMVAATWVERGITGRTNRIAFEVGGDSQFDMAGAAQNGFLVEFGFRPDFDGMASQGVVAIFAGIVGGAAFHFNGDDVEWGMVVKAAGLGIEV